jgi:hypothetical protein
LIVNTVDAYSETDLDWDVQWAYDARVIMEVLDQNNNIINNHVYSDQSSTGVASVEVQFSGTSGYTYIAVSRHFAVADLSDFYDYYPYETFYYDNYYFGYFTNEGISVPWYYYFLSPSFQDIQRSNPLVDLGSTNDYAMVHVNPLPEVIFNRATLGNTSANFINAEGYQYADLNATQSGEAICGHALAGFSFIVTFDLPNGTTEVLRSPGSNAKAFGDTNTAKYRVVNTDLTTNLSSTPKSGQMTTLAFIRTDGSAQQPYNAIKITVSGRYGSGQPFKGVGTVHIACP